MEDFCSPLLHAMTRKMLDSCGSSGRPLAIDVVAAIVEDVVRANDEKFGCSSEDLPPHAMTVFHGTRAPPIGVKNYLERIHKYANCSPACFVFTFIYLERFAQSQSDIIMSSLNVHRLLITSFMLAVKFLDDTYFTNAYYAKVGGISTLEMNRLEVDFLFRIKFRLRVTTTEFAEYCDLLQMWDRHPLPPLALTSSCSKVLSCSPSNSTAVTPGLCDMDADCSSTDTVPSDPCHGSTAAEVSMVVDSHAQYILAAS